jgi:hypothetical protein
VTVPLLTHHWRGLLDHFGQGLTERPAFTPVAVSVGVPRSLPWARSLRCSEITPWGLVGRSAPKLAPDEWEERYLSRLDRHGVEAITASLTTTHASYGGRPLVLLCWEQDPADCHRGMFARWWQVQTGQRVPEVEGLDPLSITKALTEASK